MVGIGFEQVVWFFDFMKGQITDKRMLDTPTNQQKMSS